jgi:mono/diheme cytochrome c family protein
LAVPVTVKVGAFALAVMGSYTWYANSIPQIESKPPEELSLEGGNVTPQQLVAAGEKIFREKGQCTTCHGIGRAGRGPDLTGVGGRAATRKPGMKATAYLVESLLTPSAFVVEGFPNIMPNVSRAPIGLNRSELWATTAFLESLGGTVDVKLEDVPQVASASAGAAPALELPGDAKAGQAVFTGKGACIACHKAGAIGASPVGPDLSNIAGSQTPEYIMGKILDPASKGTVSGFPPNVMPKTFGQQLTAKEYLDLVSFLLTLKGGAAPAAAGQPAAKAQP